MPDRRTILKWATALPLFGESRIIHISYGP
jgi:hypothetical protein